MLVRVPVLDGGGEDGVPDNGLGEGVAGLVGRVDGFYEDEDLLCVPTEEGREVWPLRLARFERMRFWTANTQVEIKSHICEFFPLDAMIVRPSIRSSVLLETARTSLSIGQHTLEHCGV